MTMINQQCRLVFLAVVVVSTIGCAASPRQRPVGRGPVDTGPGTVTAARKFLEGNWTLESLVLNAPGRDPIALQGSGSLSYDSFGNLRMEIRADQASADLLRDSGITMRDGVISTNGRTVIDLPNRTLTYFLEGQSSSFTTGGGPLATSRPRHWEVTADSLTLTTHDDNGKPYAISRWKRNP